MTGHAWVGSRRLVYETWGSTDGAPVFLLHGSPGSRQGPRPRGLELDLLGVRLITFDRPGYGDSDRLPDRRIAHAADDVEAIADALGIERFAVAGRSGGAPHALACAAQLSTRVTAAASLVGLAPPDAAGLDWLAGMGHDNRSTYEVVWECFRTGNMYDLVAHLARMTDVLSAPDSNFPRREHDDGMPDADRRVLDDAGIRHVLTEAFRFAVRNRQNLQLEEHENFDGDVLAGWLDDILAFCRDWEFRVESIDVPVLLWHGGKDVFSPVDHSRWLARRIGSRAELKIDPRAAHLGAIKVLRDVLEWLSKRS